MRQIGLSGAYVGRIWNILDIRGIGRRVVTEIDAVAKSED
jgi:hypothetical protein